MVGTGADDGFRHAGRPAACVIGTKDADWGIDNNGMDEGNHSKDQELRNETGCDGSDGDVAALKLGLSYSTKQEWRLGAEFSWVSGGTVTDEA